MCKSCLPGPGIQARCTSLAQMPVFQFCSAECRIFSELLPFCLFRVFDDDGPPDASSFLFSTAWPFWQLVAQNSALIQEGYNLELIEDFHILLGRKAGRVIWAMHQQLGTLVLSAFAPTTVVLILFFQATTDLFFIFYICVFCVSFCILWSFLMCWQRWNLSMPSLPVAL